MFIFEIFTLFCYHIVNLIGGFYMDNLIDLHTHSYISDGKDSPSQVIETANKNKLKAVVLTDNDSILF